MLNKFVFRKTNRTEWTINFLPCYERSKSLKGIMLDINSRSLWNLSEFSLIKSKLKKSFRTQRTWSPAAAEKMAKMAKKRSDSISWEVLLIILNPEWFSRMPQEKKHISHLFIFLSLFSFFLSKWREIKHVTWAFTLTKKIIIASRIFLYWSNCFVWSAANSDFAHVLLILFLKIFCNSIIYIYLFFFWFNKHVKNMKWCCFINTGAYSR